MLHPSLRAPFLRCPAVTAQRCHRLRNLPLRRRHLRRQHFGHSPVNGCYRCTTARANRQVSYACPRAHANDARSWSPCTGRRHIPIGCAVQHEQAWDQRRSSFALTRSRPRRSKPAGNPRHKFARNSNEVSQRCRPLTAPTSITPHRCTSGIPKVPSWRQPRSRYRAPHTLLKSSFSKGCRQRRATRKQRLCTMA
jgi:hypothetical protein